MRHIIKWTYNAAYDNGENDIIDLNENESDNDSFENNGSETEKEDVNTENNEAQK